MKYVRWGSCIIFFSDAIVHSVFRHLPPVSAGFCYIDCDNQKVKCYGESVSLGLSSLEEDSDIATLQMFGNG